MGKQKEVIFTAKKGGQVETAIFDVSGSKWVNGFSFCIAGFAGGEVTTVIFFLSFLSLSLTHPSIFFFSISFLQSLFFSELFSCSYSFHKEQVLGLSIKPAKRS